MMGRIVLNFKLYNLIMRMNYKLTPPPPTMHRPSICKLTTKIQMTFGCFWKVRYSAFELEMWVYILRTFHYFKVALQMQNRDEIVSTYEACAWVQVWYNTSMLIWKNLEKAGRGSVGMRLYFFLYIILSKKLYLIRKSNSKIH